MGKPPTPGLAAELEGKPPADANVITLTLDGVDHVLNVGALNALQAAKMRAVTGFSYVDLVDRCAPPNVFDLEAVAVFVWAAALQAGTIEDYGVLAEGITGDVVLKSIADALAEPGDEIEEPGDPKE